MQQASSVKKKYSEVHNLAVQGPSWDIDKKFGTEPIAQERCFTKSSRWLTCTVRQPQKHHGILRPLHEQVETAKTKILPPGSEED